MSRAKPRSLEEFVKFALQRRYTQASRLRKLIDRRKEVKQIFELDDQYLDRYNKFVDAYNKAIDGMSEEEVAISGKTLDMSEFGGEGRIQLRSAQKITQDNANFRQIKNFYNKLVPEIAQERDQFGHKNISVLRASIALVLDGDAQGTVLTKTERQQLLALYSIVKQIDAITELDGTDKFDLINDLRDIAQRGPNLKAQWQKDVDIVKGISGQIEIEVEYEELNQYKGRLAAWVGEIFSGIIQEDTEIFEKYIGEIDISKMKGSNNLEEDIEDAFGEYLGRGFKTNYKKKKPRPTKASASKKSKKVKTTTPQRKKSKKAKKAVAQKGIASQPLLLLTALNKKLPETVGKNMTPPRLTYQTGRFADSVRITDINNTAQGYPSIGYTYQKDPYQVFEKGGRYSPDYDPRKLIDMSIREIAAQFAIGRFYTRRE